MAHARRSAAALGSALMAELLHLAGRPHRPARRRDLSVSESTWAMRQVMAGATPSQLAGFLVALRAKGETVDEIVGFRDAILEAALPLPVDPTVLDIVGTGGDRFGTVNVSTMAAVVAAASGVPVVKHGNRAASSSSGSSDVLARSGHRPRRCRRSGSPRRSPRRASRSPSPRRSTRIPPRRRRPAPSSACRRSSTSSARCATRPAPRRTRSASRSSTGCRSSPACSRPAARPRSSSAATTGSTN